MQSYIVTRGDSRNLALPDGSVQMVVTSIPYWGLRRYLDDTREIGREDTLQAWLDNMVACAREWRRVLRDDGTLWVNCGDAYAANRGYQVPDSKWRDVGNGDGMDAESCGLKPKDIIGLAWRLAFALQADGWWLRSPIVWVKGIDWSDAEREGQRRIRSALALVRKQAEGSLWGLERKLDIALRYAERAVDRLVLSGPVMPESVNDRPTSAYEMLFLLSKSERYYYDLDAIRVPASPETHARMQRGVGENKYTAGAPGQTPHTLHQPRPNVRGHGLTPKGALADAGRVRANDSFHATTSQVVASRNARNVWRINPGQSPTGGYLLPDGRTVNHFAAFPQELPARAILAGTSEAGACATCGAPFVRVRRPTPEYASRLGDWGDDKQDALEGRGHGVGAAAPVRPHPTKRGTPTVSEYETVGWVPSCRCCGEPIKAETVCKKCGGDGLEKAYPRGNEPSKAQVLPGRSPFSIQTDHDGKDFAKPQPTGNPCPACLCPDCRGTGKRRTSTAREGSYFPDEEQGSDGKRGRIGNIGGNSMMETGEPCSTCKGIGATGRTNEDTWPAEVLAKWPRRPCIVLDSMAGTGQTGRAALSLGRSVVLNDLHPDYCDLSQARLAAWPKDLPGAGKGKGAQDGA